MSISENSKDEKNQDSDSPIKLSTTYSKIKETGKHGFIYGLTNTLTLAVGLVESGSELHNLKKLAHNLGFMNYVYFVGSVNHDILPYWYNRLVAK